MSVSLGDLLDCPAFGDEGALLVPGLFLVRAVDCGLDVFAVEIDAPVYESDNPFGHESIPN
jgi:hypothetical protein